MVYCKRKTTSCSFSLNSYGLKQNLWKYFWIEKKAILTLMCESRACFVAVLDVGVADEDDLENHYLPNLKLSFFQCFILLQQVSTATEDWRFRLRFDMLVFRYLTSPCSVVTSDFDFKRVITPCFTGRSTQNDFHGPFLSGKTIIGLNQVIKLLFTSLLKVLSKIFANIFLQLIS